MAVRMVAVSEAPAGMPAVLRMAGLTATMSAIVKKVVSPGDNFAADGRLAVSERKELIEPTVQFALGETQDCTFAAARRTNRAWTLSAFLACVPAITDQ
jgi:hypothetical protein